MGYAEKSERFEWARPESGYGSNTTADEVRESHEDVCEMGNGALGYTHTGEPLLHMSKGVEMQGPSGELLREVNKEINYWRTKKGATSAILGCDAHVDFQPNLEPDTGCGLRGGSTKNIQCNSLEVQHEAEIFKLLQQHGLKLEDTTRESLAQDPSLSTFCQPHHRQLLTVPLRFASRCTYHFSTDCL